VIPLAWVSREGTEEEKHEAHTCELVFARLFLLFIEALSRLSHLWRKFLQQPQIPIWVAKSGIHHAANI
jgi:hypothetical protein